MEKKVYIASGVIIGICIILLIVLMSSNDGKQPETVIVAQPTQQVSALDAKPTNEQVAVLSDDRFTKVILPLYDDKTITVIQPPKYKVQKVEDPDVLISFVSEERSGDYPAYTVDYMFIEEDNAEKLMEPPIVQSFMVAANYDELSLADKNTLTEGAYSIFSAIEYDTDYYMRGKKALDCQAYFSIMQTSLFDEEQPDLALPNGYYDIKFPKGTLRIVVNYHDDAYVDLFDKIVVNNYKLEGTDYLKIETDAMEHIDSCFKLFVNNTLNGDYSRYFEHLLNR